MDKHMKTRKMLLTTLTASAFIIGFSGHSCAANGDVMIENNGSPTAANGFRFIDGKVSIGTQNTERSLNIVSSEAGGNFIRVHPSFGAFFMLRWRTDNNLPDKANWLFSVDQTVGEGGFSIIDRLNGDARRLSIHTNGNVGIGTTNPTHKLSVNGSIRAKEVIVDSGWADYVFTSDYSLLPLDKLDSYIQKNGKLPGLPTAAEVEKNGIDLAEANRILLEKVEELTLHVIALNKRIKDLEQ